MYLSKMNLNCRSKEVQRELGNLYELHRTIMRAFPSDKNRAECGVLFRVEENQQQDPFNCYVLVQSIIKPDWSVLGLDENFLTNSGIQMKEFLPEIKKGKVFRFMIRVNPTRRKNDTKQLVPVMKEDDLMDWFIAKGKLHGFHADTESLIIIKRPSISIYKKYGEKTNKITMTFIDFSGYLSIDDEREFQHTLENGIGRGRSFGAGLLSLAKYQ